MVTMLEGQVVSEVLTPFSVIEQEHLWRSCFNNILSTPIANILHRMKTFQLSFFVVFLLSIACLKVYKHGIFWNFLAQIETLCARGQSSKKMVKLFSLLAQHMWKQFFDKSYRQKYFFSGSFWSYYIGS
jgi:hypothetical protein